MALNLTLRKSFLYIFATVGLVLCIVGGISLINLGLKAYVFTKAGNNCIYNNYPSAFDKSGNPVTPDQAAQKQLCEEQNSSNRQNQAAEAVAMLIVGVPLYLYHWAKIRKENQV